MSDSQSSYPKAIMTCPECQGYMQQNDLDSITRALLGAEGKWRCLLCGHVQSSPTKAKRPFKPDRSTQSAVEEKWKKEVK